MDVKPSLVEAQLRLRMDDALADDLAAAIDQAHAQALTFLDGALYPSADEAVAAQDVRGIVVTADIIAAQLLLADVLIGKNDQAARDAKRRAAIDMLRPHRNVGC